MSDDGPNEFCVFLPDGGGVGLTLRGECMEEADALLSPDQARALSWQLLVAANRGKPVAPVAEARGLVTASPTTLRVMR